MYISKFYYQEKKNKKIEVFLMANIVLPEVEIISTINNNTNILIEDSGEIKRIAADAFS
jgi:hypothetical protein